MSERVEGFDNPDSAGYACRPSPGPAAAAERMGTDAVARAALRRSRHAVFGNPAADPVTPQAAMFAGQVAQAVGDRAEAFVPAPSGPLGGSAPAPLPPPHEVVAAAPRRGRSGSQPVSGLPGVLGGPESVPLPSAPALVCDGSDRIVRVNPALLGLAGRTSEGGAGLFGMRLPQLVVGPDTDARLVRPDGRLVRVRVLRWDVPGRELRAVVLVELGKAAAGTATGAADRRADHHWVAALERMARAGTWSYELATASLRRSAALGELYRSMGLDLEPDPTTGVDSVTVESGQVAQLCAALRSGTVGWDHHVELELPGGHRLDCRAEVECATDGTPVRVVGVVRDVGAHRSAEIRVERSGRRFADLVAVMPDGVGMLDPGGRFVEANPALCALLDRPMEDLRELSITTIAADPSGERPAGSLPEWLRLVRPGASHGYTVESVALLRADGTPVWCDLHVTITTSDEGGWRWMVVCSDLSEQRRAADELARAARVDALTGLPTRVAMLELVDGLLAGSGRETVAVVCADIDDFRRINSSLGHEAGDEVLVMLARRLREDLPPGCTAARLSGDEFLVVCADHGTVGGPAELARTVARVLAGRVVVRDRPVPLTVSTGVAARTDTEGEQGAADLLRFAETAMYDAKHRHGRDGVGIATDGMVESATATLPLEVELYDALAGEGLLLHYQPVVSPDGVVRSAEALVRWQHPERGMMLPADFLPVAERCGLLRELDLWVLKAAVREAARWPAHDGQVPGVAVNLAGLLPADPDFLATVTEVVTGSGLAWNRLSLELVETSLIELPPHALAAMAELTERGVQFAVDDFGTGRSSLSRLKQLPAQVVKLDRAFVTGVADDPMDRAVVRAVVELARVMGCTVVAEGVETVEQFAVLGELGIDAWQGWLFARPLPASELRALLVGDRLSIPG